MFPQSNKLCSSRDFTVTIRRGRRIGRKTLVLHIRGTVASSGEDKTDTQIARLGGPCIGLVVFKAVGNAVTCHAVSHKLRHVMTAAAQDPPPTMDIVVRVPFASATAISQELSHNVQSAFVTYECRRQFA